MTVGETSHRFALYLDLELTCWDTVPPVGMKQEIIEIGIVEMDLQTLAVMKDATYFVRPRRWEISQHCANLTGITDADIRTARPFQEVLLALTEEFQPAGKVCGTWGSDAVLISRACNAASTKSPFRHMLDVAKLFQNIFLLKDEAGLSAAIQMLKLSFHGTPHTAVNDAMSTAMVHAEIIRRMRRQSVPPPTPARERDEAPSRSDFAQKLSECLGIRSTEIAMAGGGGGDQPPED